MPKSGWSYNTERLFLLLMAKEGGIELTADDLQRQIELTAENLQKQIGLTADDLQKQSPNKKGGWSWDRYSYHHYRATQVYNVESGLTASDIDAILNAQEHTCYYCGADITGAAEIDHYTPLSKGGSNTPGNVVMCCAWCNRSKGDRLPNEWNPALPPTLE